MYIYVYILFSLFKKPVPRVVRPPSPFDMCVLCANEMERNLAHWQVQGDTHQTLV